jgi:hypothetical protein
MSFLRTNYRLTGKQLDYDAIGGALIRGSGIYGGAAGGGGVASGVVNPYPYGGFVLINVVGSDGGAGIAQSSAGIPTGASGYAYFNSAYGILSRMYGEGKSGYAVLPVDIIDRGYGDGSTSGSVMLFMHSAVNSGSITLIKIVARSFAASWASGVTTLLDGASAVFRWWGFIVSSP